MSNSVSRTNVSRAKVYVTGSRRDVRVPFTEVSLSDSPGRSGPQPNEPVRLYDTSGPGSDPAQGLPALRRDWIARRGDTEEYDGRPVRPRDDGRGALRRAGITSSPDQGRPRRAQPGRTVTQMH
ncbi:MAG TPA: hypothetical protein VF954_02670, partial [Acidimicrobiales bacterium]